MMMTITKRSNKPSNVRKWLFGAAVGLWGMFAGNSVFAEPSALKPPEMLSYSDLDVSAGDIFEHGANRISYAGIQGDQVVVHSIGVYGQIKKEISFPKQELEYVAEFHHTQDQGYIAGGGSQILKVDEKGQKEWGYTLAKADSYIVSVDQLKNGKYAAAINTPGSTSNSHVLHWILFSETGKALHEGDLEGVAFDRIHSLQHTSDGGFVVSGIEYQDGGKGQVVLAKFAPSGQVKWKQSIAVAEDSQNVDVLSLAEAHDGSIVTAGYYNHPNPNDPIRYLTTGYALSVDRSGKLQWTNILDAAFDRSMVNDIQPASDGGFIATGKVNEDWHGTVSRQSVWGIAPDGNTTWTKVINRASYNAGEFVQPLQNGQTLLIGTADGAYKLIKLGAAVGQN
ncbi:hypothetical protein FHS19_002496 [Paenibacillus rhizosphaerae]|uniref:Uncharacterized protein n=1 Tax=Paenibacillus rhizosphaerae TaxID=297318 RepID=A0A839TME6_9BACL|nr:hypothetical protein [Paenibacillus rhizosphaerae]MBB3127842.1 hypothetical protein [Paenibacillus rhizosphaerae]